MINEKSYGTTLISVKPWITALVIALAAHNYRMIYNWTITTTITFSNIKNTSTNQIYHSLYFRDLIKNFHKNGFERNEGCIEHSSMQFCVFVSIWFFCHCIWRQWFSFDMKYSTLFFVGLMWMWSDWQNSEW